MEEYYSYEDELMEERYTAGQRAGLKEGRREGKIEGRKEGRKEGRREGRLEERASVIKTMLKENLPLEQIMRFTGFTKDEIAEVTK